MRTRQKLGSNELVFDLTKHEKKVLAQAAKLTAAMARVAEPGTPMAAAAKQAAEGNAAVAKLLPKVENQPQRQPELPMAGEPCDEQPALV